MYYILAEKYRDKKQTTYKSESMKVGKCKTVAAFKVQIYYMKHYTTRHMSGKAWRQFVVSTLGDFQGIRGNLQGNLCLKPFSNFTCLLNPGTYTYTC